MPAPSAEVRLAYVCWHLEAAYHVPAPARPGYHAGAGVQLAPPTAATEAFFRSSIPYPIRRAEPGKGTDTEARSGAALPPGAALFADDLVSAIFYWLSGWQEVHTEERDAFGRFPYAASLQAQLGLGAVPVADCLLAALRTHLQAASGLLLRPRPLPALAVSHDVDHLFTGWRPALRRGYLRAAGARLVGRPDPFDNLPALARLVLAETGTAPTFYFLGAQGRHRLGPNADYDVAAPAVQRRLEELEKLGCPIGLHGAFGASDDAGQLRHELARLNRPGAGVRFHFLRFDPRRTPALLAEVGVAHDATLGFAEHAGFRHGTARPFHLFDFRRQQPFPTEYRPLHAMDVTFRNAAYQPTAAAAIPGAVQALAHAARTAAGTLSLLWHNEYLVPWETHLGAATLRATLRAALGTPAGGPAGFWPT